MPLDLFPHQVFEIRITASAGCLRLVTLSRVCCCLTGVIEVLLYSLDNRGARSHCVQDRKLSLCPRQTTLIVSKTGNSRFFVNDIAHCYCNLHSIGPCRTRTFLQALVWIFL